MSKKSSNFAADFARANKNHYFYNQKMIKGMKKFFSFMAAALVAFSFASCNGGNPGEVKGKDFKISVSDITATSAVIEVLPTDTDATYFSTILEAKDVTPAMLKNLDTIAEFSDMYIKYLVAYYTYYGKKVSYDDFLYEGAISKKDGKITDLTPATEYIVYAHKMNADGEASGELAYLTFKTKDPEKKALKVSSADYTFYEKEGAVEIHLSDSEAGLSMGLVLLTKNLNGTFTEENFFEDGEYVYNYVQWGDDDDDWGAIVKFEMTGSLDADKKEYTINGKALAENGVEYSFNAKAVEDKGAGVAPATDQVRKIDATRVYDLKFKPFVGNMNVK